MEQLQNAFPEANFVKAFSCVQSAFFGLIYIAVEGKLFNFSIKTGMQNPLRYRRKTEGFLKDFC